MGRIVNKEKKRSSYVCGIEILWFSPLTDDANGKDFFIVLFENIVILSIQGKVA